MDKTTLKQIKENLKPHMKTAGFKTEGQWYVRVTNRQICQIINFQGFSGGDSFTVNIGIHPLCAEEITNYKYLNLDIRIGVLMGKGDTWWNYTKESADQVAQIIVELVLPVLERCSSYEALLAIADKDRIAKEIEKETDPLFAPLSAISEHMWYGTLFYLSMTMDTCDKAAFYLEKQIAAQRDTAEENLKWYDLVISEATTESAKADWLVKKEEYFQFFQKDIDRLLAMKEQLKQGNYSGILDKIAQNEKAGLENLSKYVI